MAATNRFGSEAFSLLGAISVLGFLFNAHSYAEKICKVAVLVGNFIVQAGTNLKNWLDGVSNYATESPKPRYDEEQASAKVKNHNDALGDLDRKRARDRSLNERDQQTYDESRRARTQVLHQLREVRLDDQLRQTAAGKNTVESFDIDRDHIHICEGKVGQTFAGKVCPSCNEPMFLQWTVDPARDPLKRFFWSCPNYYTNECRRTESWQLEDQSIISSEGLEEYTIPAEELKQITLQSDSRNIVVKRMNRNRGRQVNAYECPIHGESMVLYKKKDTDFLLDMYHFKCARWKGSNDPSSCDYKLKLKSAGQLAEVLKQLEGRGIL